MICSRYTKYCKTLKFKSSGNWDTKKACIKNRSSNLNEAFSEESASRKAQVLGSENSDIHGVTS